VPILSLDNASQPRLAMTSSTNYYNYSGSQRPNTANSVIEMLAIEKAHDGSGLTLCSGGVFVASQCHVILFVMSGIFTAVGVVISAISYRPRDFGEDFQKYLARQEWSSDLKVMGPIVMVFGAAMFVLGMSLCLINRTISKDDVQSFDSAAAGAGHVTHDTKYYMEISKKMSLSKMPTQGNNKNNLDRDPGPIPTPGSVESVMAQQPGSVVQPSEHKQINFAQTDSHPSPPAEADHSIGGLDQAINCDTSGTGSVVGLSGGTQPSATVIDDTCTAVSADSTKPSHGIPPQKSNKVYPQLADSRQGLPSEDLVLMPWQYPPSQQRAIKDIACFPPSPAMPPPPTHYSPTPGSPVIAAHSGAGPM